MEMVFLILKISLLQKYRHHFYLLSQVNLTVNNFASCHCDLICTQELTLGEGIKKDSYTQY